MIYWVKAEIFTNLNIKLGKLSSPFYFIYLFFEMFK